MTEDYTQVIDRGGRKGLATLSSGGKGKRVHDWGARKGLSRVRRSHKKAKKSKYWEETVVKPSHKGKLRRRAEHTRGGIKRDDDINLTRMDEIADRTGDTELKREVTLARTFRNSSRTRKKSKVAKRSGGGKTHYGTHSRGHHGGPCDASCKRGKRAHHHRR